MLEEAKNYAKELNKKLGIHFVTKENHWYYGNPKFATRLTIDETGEDKHLYQRVSINKDGTYNGVIQTGLYPKKKLANGIGIISFNQNNPVFIKDLVTFIWELYVLYEVETVRWQTFEGTPFHPQLIKMAKKFGEPIITRTGHRRTLGDNRVHELIKFQLPVDTINWEVADKFVRRNHNDFNRSNSEN